MTTCQRKPMQADKPGFIAPWELRVGKLRVYYEVCEEQVRIVAVGLKPRDRLFIGGKKVEVEP